MRSGVEFALAAKIAGTRVAVSRNLGSGRKLYMAPVRQQLGMQAWRAREESDSLKFHVAAMLVRVLFSQADSAHTEVKKTERKTVQTATSSSSEWKLAVAGNATTDGLSARFKVGQCVKKMRFTARCMCLMS